MKNMMKKCICVLLCVIMTLTGTTVISAKVTEKAKTAALAAYSKTLSNYDTSVSFSVKDLNADGVPELLIDTAATSTSDNKKGKKCLSLYTYKDGKAILLYDSWVLDDNYHYSPKTHCIMMSYSWKGRESTSVYDIDKEGTALQSLYSTTLEDGKYSCYLDGKTKTISKKTHEKTLKKYMPDKKLLKFEYINTAANRTKYLK